MNIKEILESKLEEILLRSEANKQGLHIEQVIDPLDRAVDESNRLTAASLGERDRGLVLAIKEALQRVEAGVYGVCLRCEEEITPRRLQAVPWAVLCVPCQEHQERTEKAKTPVKRLADHGRAMEAEAERKRRKLDMYI